MSDESGATAFLPDSRGLRALREAAAGCRGCPLHEPATQTVFGEGPASARVVMMGEAPGDVEDRSGHPFVGPAGGLLDRVLDEVGIDRGDVYVTNAVKHFRFRRSGKRRLHQTPTQAHIRACRPWWVAELDAVDPRVVVCLGATAAKAVFGSSFRITQSRGTVLEPPESWPKAQFLATVHPSAVLRADDRDAAYGGLRADLAVVATLVGDAAPNQ